MQRENSYRGKRVDNGEWVYGCLLTGFFLRGGQDIPYIMTPEGADYDCFEDITAGNGIYEVIPETVGQYTGLKDKNGKGIYEGDILDISYCFAGKGIVKFGKYKQCDMSSDYECGNQGFYVDSMKDADLYRHDLYYYAPISEVIGNIYENPELLETN